MKRFLAVLLILAMIFSTTACKPDNITYPVEIQDPTAASGEETPEQDATEEQIDETEQEPSEEQAEDPEQAEEPKQTDGEETAEEQTEEEAPADEPAADAETAATDGEPQAEGAEETPDTNPLAAADFVPANGTASTLPVSGMIKPGAAVSALKNRTITLYTADDQPAFSYTDENGKTVSEWQWMENLAAENGFILKYSVKNSNISLKAQRVALYAGKKLSLVQMGAGELGDGMTLAASAADFLDTAIRSFGISKRVLELSDHKLFAPVGNVETLWYDPILMPEGADPQTLSASNQWTVEQFKTACAATPEKAAALQIESILPWATLSGRSPLTLLEGKLDSNLNAGVTRNVWSALKTLDLNALLTPPAIAPEELAAPLFSYTATPAIGEGQTLKYAPLPAMEGETAGTVTYTGTFLALPKYERDAESIRAALTFAELWCNRYTETRAAALQTLGVTGDSYQQYCTMAEANGYLILRSPEIEELAKTYLSGVTDPEIDMDEAYAQIKDDLNAIITAKNLYY